MKFQSGKQRSSVLPVTTRRSKVISIPVGMNACCCVRGGMKLPSQRHLPRTTPGTHMQPNCSWLSFAWNKLVEETKTLQAAVNRTFYMIAMCHVERIHHAFSVSCFCVWRVARAEELVRVPPIYNKAFNTRRCKLKKRPHLASFQQRRLVLGPLPERITLPVCASNRGVVGPQIRRCHCKVRQGHVSQLQTDLN